MNFSILLYTNLENVVCYLLCLQEEQYIPITITITISITITITITITIAITIHSFIHSFIPIPSEAATLTWWDGLRGLMILLGYAGGSYTPGRFNLAGQAIRRGS